MRKCFIIIVCIHFFIGNAYAVDKIGTTAAKFLHMNVGSRAVGMGGAFTSIANDATAMYWNPAGLGFHKVKEVFFNHSNWIADTVSYTHLTLPTKA